MRLFSQRLTWLAMTPTFSPRMPCVHPRCLRRAAIFSPRVTLRASLSTLHLSRHTSLHSTGIKHNYSFLWEEFNRKTCIKTPNLKQTWQQLFLFNRLEQTHWALTTAAVAAPSSLLL